MNLNNSDKEFFENLFSDLSKKIDDAVRATGKSEGTDSGGAAGSVAGKIFKTGALQLSKGLQGAAQTAFSVVTNKLDQSMNNALAFGEILSRSAVASGRASSLLGASINRSTGALEFGIPAINQEFRKFGFSLTDAARTLDAAIKANIKDTGMVAQRFLATSKGLGASMSTTNRFLATQTNVLGTSTEASTFFGESILGLASSNGILADSILEAVNAFTKTTREQQAIFGAQSAQVVARAVAATEGLATGAGTAELLRALTSPENILKLPALAGRLGITPVTATELRDPGQMQRFITEAIPALASFAEREVLGAPAETGMALTKALTQTFGSAFELQNLQRATLLMGELGEKGQGIGSIFEETILSQQDLKQSQDTILATNIEAAKAAATFNLELALAPSYFKAIAATNELLSDAMATSAEELREKFGGLIDAVTAVDGPLRMLGTSVSNLSNNIINVGAGMLGMVSAALAKIVSHYLGIKLPIPGGGGGVTGRPTGKPTAGSAAANAADDAARAAAGATDDVARAGSRGMAGAAKAMRFFGNVLAPALVIADEATREEGSVGRGAARVGGQVAGTIGIGSILTAAGLGGAALLSLPGLLAAGAGGLALYGIDQAIDNGYNAIARVLGEEGQRTLDYHEESEGTRRKQLEELGRLAQSGMMGAAGVGGFTLGNSQLISPLYAAPGR